MKNEFSLITKYFTRPTHSCPPGAVNPMDDCGLLHFTPGTKCMVTTDMLAEGTHFFKDTNPVDLGWKAVSVNLSDLAASGAKPRYIQLALCLPKQVIHDEAWVAQFAKGLFDCTDRFGVSLVGGDLTHGPLNICITAMGEIPANQATNLCRSGAKINTDIWVSGALGLANLGLQHLKKQLELPDVIRARALAALHRPQPRIELGLALRENELADAAIDVSDGLLADLGHILEQSEMAATLYLKTLPLLSSQLDIRHTLATAIGPDTLYRAQLGGGDDYELCFCAPVENRLKIAALAAQFELPLWRIGITQAGKSGEINVLDENNQAIDIPHRGYDHCAQES